MHQKVTNSTSSEELRDDGSDRDLIVEDRMEDEPGSHRGRSNGR